MKRLDSAVPAGTHIAIVEYGINDRFARIDPNVTRDNLDTMLTRLRARGIEVLLLGYRGSAGLETLAEKHGALFTMFGFPGSDDPKYRVQGDPQERSQGVAHFNSAGYDVIVSRMLPLAAQLTQKVSAAGR